MLGNKEDKHLLRENTRLNFITSLQTSLLPHLLLLQVTLRHISEARSNAGSWGQCTVVSLCHSLFLTHFWCSTWVLHRMQSLQWWTCSGMGLSTGHSPFGVIPAPVWGDPWATVPFGVCMLHHPTTAPLILLFPLFPPSVHSSVPSQICLHRGTTNSSEWLGFGKWWVYCQAGWEQLCMAQGSPRTLSTEATPEAASATRTLSFTPDTEVS